MEKQMKAIGIPEVDYVIILNNAENLIKAHAMLESQQAQGKIVLERF